MKPETVATIILTMLGAIAGSRAQYAYDHRAIEQAHQAEMQANGLEDQCKAKLKQAEEITQTGAFIGLCPPEEHVAYDGKGRFECVKP